MTENEKRLRESLGPSMLHHLELLLAEKVEERRAARTEALEEAKDVCGVVAGEYMKERNHEAARALGAAGRRIRALITTPAPASIPVERVREVLRNVRDDGHADLPPGQGVRNAATALATTLGVPLDAAQEYRCLRCHTPVTGHVLHSCKVTP